MVSRPRVGVHTLPACLAAGAVGVLLVLGACQGGDNEVQPTGQALFLRHCASCHGLSGKGDGPLASSLQRDPSDLTEIARRSGGSFNEADVMAVIDGQRSVTEHGPREMPVWGAVFEQKFEGTRYGSLTTLYHGRALTDYLRSIQE
jgi:mono/diheme cytochrome c family protein